VPIAGADAQQAFSKGGRFQMVEKREIVLATSALIAAAALLGLYAFHF
jgi:hypothetical protein